MLLLKWFNDSPAVRPDYKKQLGQFINKNNIPFAEGNAIKYLCRHKQKGQKQDLEKAKHYINMAIERDYGDEAEMSQVFKSKGNK